jgi:hypothetical protein
MPLQRNDFISQSLTTVYTSPSQMTDIRTGQAYGYGGSYVGVYFDLTEAEAQALSNNTLHAGRYRFVKIDSTATAANVLTGTIGLQRSVALGVNVITSYDQGLGTGVGLIHPVVFLAPLTATQIAAGAYVFVQELGVASVLANSSSITAPAGTPIITTTGGVVTNGTTLALYVGQSLATAVISTTFLAQLEFPAIQG